jgi:hemerythrin
MLHWTEQFTTGSRELDYQHQTLIDNINDLETMLALKSPSRHDYASMLGVVDFIEHFAEKHFACEEHCMEHFRCPCRELNKNAHAEFLTLLQQFKNRNLTEGFPHELLIQLHATMKQWIMEHIFQIDSQLKPFIKGNASGADTTFLKLGENTEPA